MATIVNTTPAPAAQENSNGSGFIVGMIVLLLIVVLIIFYGIPYMGSAFHSAAPQVNVPSKVDVNVHNSGAAK